MTTDSQLSPEDIDRLADEFLMHVQKPAGKPQYQFLLGFIGQGGSGKSTAAQIIAEHIHGTVVFQADDVRYIISQERERNGTQIDWGQNVTTILMAAAEKRLRDGYSVIFAGHTSSEEERAAIQNLADAFSIPACYIRIRIDPAVAESRLQAKYQDASWVSGFGSFRVHTLDEMLDNIRQRAESYEALMTMEIPGLLADVENNGTFTAFEKQLHKLQIP